MRYGIAQVCGINLRGITELKCNLMLVLATDLDGTFLGGSEQDKNSLYRLVADHASLILVFVTGRGLASVAPLLQDPIIPDPHYIICDVGATILDGRSLEPVEPIQSEITQLWPGGRVLENSLASVSGIKKQEVPMDRRSSWFFDGDTDLGRLEEVVAGLGCDLILSAGKFADILPRGVNKGFTLKRLVEHLGIPGQQVMVAGDTLNDLSLFRTGFKGVVVGGAEPALLAATADQSQVYHAKRPGCGGILEAFGTAGFHISTMPFLME